jgi:hypothetical protein
MNPAVKSEILEIVCHYLNIPFDSTLEPLKDHKDRWATYCPVHEADKQGTPSLHVYAGKHSKTGIEEMHFRCVSKACDYRKIVACLERDKLGHYKKQYERPKNLEVNIPPHAEPDWEIQFFNDWPHSDHWAFRNLNGDIIFWHVRYDNPNQKKSARGGKTKTYTRVYSVTNKDNNKQYFVHSASLKEKPIPYNSFFLQHRLEAPILIVEGPKTADAAAKMYPDYVVLTWDEGAGSYNKFDWTVLTGRTTPIVLFPDNDAAGINAMKGLAKILIALELKPKITFLEMLPDYKEGWDLADEVPSGVEHPDTLFDDLLDIEFSEEELKELKGNSILKQKLEEYDRRFMPVLGGGDWYYYDIENPTQSSSAGCPYPMIKDRALYIAAPDKYFNQETEQQEYAIDAWKEEPRKTLYNGLIYWPSSIDKTIAFGKNDNYLNMFIGFSTEPIESKPEESQWFTTHIYNLQGKEAGEYTLCYIADMIQNPGKKPGTMMLWVGTQGNGKSLIGKIIVKLLGHLNAVVLNADVLGDQFTTEYAAKLFVMPEEVPTHHRAREAIELKLKYLITADHIRLNTKNSPAYQIPSFHRIILTANSIHGMNLDEDERRITIIECKSDFLKKQNSMIADRAYFDPLFAKLEDPIAMGKLMHFLQHYKIEIDITKPFITKAKQEQQRPKDPAQAVFEELLDTAVFPDYLLPFTRGWPVERIEIPRNLLKQMVIDHCQRNRIT